MKIIKLPEDCQNPEGFWRNILTEINQENPLEITFFRENKEIKISTNKCSKGDFKVLCFEKHLNILFPYEKHDELEKKTGCLITSSLIPKNCFLTIWLKEILSIKC